MVLRTARARMRPAVDRQCPPRQLHLHPAKSSFWTPSPGTPMATSIDVSQAAAPGHPRMSPANAVQVTICCMLTALSKI